MPGVGGRKLSSGLIALVPPLPVSRRIFSFTFLSSHRSASCILLFDFIRVDQWPCQPWWDQKWNRGQIGRVWISRFNAGLVSSSFYCVQHEADNNAIFKLPDWCFVFYDRSYVWVCCVLWRVQMCSFVLLIRICLGLL